MFLNIDEKLKKDLKKEAQSKGLTLTGYIRLILNSRHEK